MERQTPTSSISGTDPTYLDAVAGVWRCEFHRFDTSEGADGYRRNSSIRPKQFSDHEECRSGCDMLLVEGLQPIGHLDRLGRALSGLINCQFFHGETIDATLLCNRAINLIARLPSTGSPLRLPFRLEAEFNALWGYSLTHSRVDEVGHPTWDSLGVASFVSPIVIHLALLVALMSRRGNESWQWDYELIGNLEAMSHMQAVVNGLASLVDAASYEIEKATDMPIKVQWFVVKAFLWTSWQRCMMLFSWWQLELTIYGTSGRETWILDNIYVQIPSSAGSQSSCGRSDITLPGYMCSWAFQALRLNPKSEGLDFRLFMQRFAAHYEILPPRCFINLQQPCDGLSPYHCERFVGAEINDQSMHDFIYCHSEGACGRLYWDESSYRQAHGSRAVSLEHTDDTYLRYVTASSSTLVISHVWSHGQGGRPETGMNYCLHCRYAAIAKAAGCDSYWIDTACIPSDHTLRKEAIMEINQTFMVGKLTIICDKDLMAIDVSNLNIATQELILVTMLVCDWNLRAWTMLEAFKAWVNLNILCKDNKIVSVKDTLISVLQFGQIDIACAFLGSTHLIPQSFRSSSYASVPGEEPQTIRVGPGRFFNVDKAGTMLSYRQASRPGDEIVIWSLICGTTEVHDKAEHLWRNSGSPWGILTFYLISSSPRIQNRKGLSWAPARPNLPLPDNSGLGIEDYIPARDTESEHAAMVKDGLVGNWFVSKFKSEEVLEENLGPKSPDQLFAITDRYVRNYRWGALLQASTLLSPKRPIQYNWRSSSTIVAVVGSNDCHEWEWKGIFAWNRDQEPVPPFDLEKIKLV